MLDHDSARSRAARPTRVHGVSRVPAWYLIPRRSRSYIGLTTWFREYKPVSTRARASSPRDGPLSEAPARDHDQYQPPLGGTFLSAEGERRAVFAQDGAGRPPARPEYLYGARRRAPASSPAPVAPEKAIPAVGHATQPQIARSAVLHAETAKISSRPLHPPRRVHEARPLAAHKRP